MSAGIVHMSVMIVVLCNMRFILHFQHLFVSFFILDRFCLLFVLLLLSFADPETQASVKSAFLEQRRDIFSSVFRGLWQDPYTLVRRVLEVCWTGLWSDPKVKRTLKVHVFNETVLAQVSYIHRS